MTAVSLSYIEQATSGRIGTFDVPCPCCGPHRRAPMNRSRPVLRIWRINESFAGFHCARCGEKGHTRDRNAPTPDPERLARTRGEAVQREQAAIAEQHRKALWLWRQRRPIARSIAETYLRDARGYGDVLPGTLGFLPAQGKLGPALIAAFGVPAEPEPGVITIADHHVRGVHITHLLPDGSDRERGEGAKITIGRSSGYPIVLAPPNDLLGLAVTEGIEDGLSVYAATRLGVWAAGCASRLPRLASTIPAYVESATIYAHADPAGQRGALELAHALDACGIDTIIHGAI
jgi:hypothetical protein